MIESNDSTNINPSISFWWSLFLRIFGDLTPNELPAILEEKHPWSLLDVGHFLAEMGQLSVGWNQHDFGPFILVLFFDLLHPLDDLHVRCCRWVLFLVRKVHRHIAQDLSLVFRQNFLLHISINLVTELVVKEQLASPSFSNEPAKPNLPFSLFFVFETVVV